MNTPTLDKVSRETMLRCAHAGLREQYKQRPLWAFVRDMTGKRSTSSAEICRELGWNPDEEGSESLPPL